jgi:hypothetical protein
MFSALIPVLAYAVFALLLNAAATNKHQVCDDLAVFPILISYRVMVWAGGALCAAVALHEFLTVGFGLLGIFLATISVATLLLPLQSIAISVDAVESLPVLRGRVVIPLKAIRKIEARDSRGWIIIYGNDTSITFTRFNADRDEFERLLRSRADSGLWS